MNRSLLTLSLIGVLGMAAIAAMGSLFVSKVGGADTVGGLRDEVSRVFGVRMETTTSLAITVVRKEDRNGLQVSFRPAAQIAARPSDLARYLDRMAAFLFERQSRRGTAEFVDYVLVLPDGKPFTRRIDRPGR
ncbi:MAG: hypothetical protein MUE73_11195 [Planctomycetes bacterium]|jgi:hypothetical protein|nr:hypothetical protein [Planctomycetota bacterium]